MNITILLGVAVILLALVILWPSRPKARSARAYWGAVVQPTVDSRQSTDRAASMAGMEQVAPGVLTPGVLGAAALKMDLDALKRELTDDPLDLNYRELGQDYPAICEILNAVPLLPNPEPQGTVPKHYTLTDFLGAATPAESLQIVGYPALVDRIERAVNANHRADMVTLFGLVAPMLSDATQRAIAAMLAATELDPAYPATVPGTSRAADLGLPVVKPTDLQMVM